MAFSRDFDFQLTNGNVVKSFYFNFGYWKNVYSLFLEPLTASSTFKLDKFLLNSQFEEFNKLMNYVCVTEQHISYDGEEVFDAEITNNTSLANIQNYGKKYLAYVDMIFATKFKNVKYYKLNKYNRLFIALYPNIPENYIRIYFGIVTTQHLEYVEGHYAFRGQRTYETYSFETEKTKAEAIYNKNVTFFFCHASGNDGFVVKGLLDSVKSVDISNGRLVYHDPHNCTVSGGSINFGSRSVYSLTGDMALPIENNYYLNNDLVKVQNTYMAHGLDGFPYTCRILTTKRINQLKNYIEYIYIDNVLEFGKPIDDTKVPDNPGGSSTTGGGDGAFDDTSDAIDIPALPPSFVSNNMVNFYVPTQMQLNAISRYMWSSFNLDTFKRLFTDPMNAFISLKYIPYRPEDVSSSTFVIGNIDTEIEISKTTNQYAQVDCGEINLKEFWGNYLDYSPYTKVEVFLPYIGIKQIDVDDVMQSTIKIVYHLDIVSGDCVCFVKITRGNLDSVLYNFEGNCGVNIPLSGLDVKNTISSIASVVADGGMVVATGGMSTAVKAGTMVRMGSSMVESAGGGAKALVQKSGTLTSNHGIMGIQKPYIIVTRPRQCVPGQQKLYTGYPSFITEHLNSLSGYTIVENIHLDGVTATDAEMIEIENLLKEGVIL